MTKNPMKKASDQGSNPCIPTLISSSADNASEAKKVYKPASLIF